MTLLPGTRLGPYGIVSPLVIVDSVSAAVREVFNMRPDNIGSPTLSRDNRQLFFVRTSQQGGVWLITLK